MPKDLTIFAVAKCDAREACFAYAFVRDVRGRGDYQLAAAEGFRSGRASPLSIEATPRSNDQLDDAAGGPASGRGSEGSLRGKFVLLTRVPSSPTHSVGGLQPTILEERNNHWTRTCGTGLLMCRSLVIDKAVDVSPLSWRLGSERASPALAKIISLIARTSGLDSVFLGGRRLGVLDHLYRSEEGLHFYGPLVRVVPQKPDFRSRAPMTSCYVQREFAAPDRAFDLHVAVSNFDEKLEERLVKFAAGEEQLEIKIRAHLTDIELHAFNPDGSLAQYLGGSFMQSIDFGITAQGASDELPPVSKGAANNEDLVRRPRLSTIAAKGPAAGPRSGAFDALRGNRGKIQSLIGRDPPAAPECRWFERDSEEQIAVIRWIKSKFENPNSKKAFLVDPFLGNDALQRVIIRQGNENIELTILISPGDVDPDAEEADTKATSSHRDKLARSATELSEKLCGTLTIFDIQRGDGSRQAFHDRYLGIVDQRGIPTYYLLSNSLSKRRATGHSRSTNSIRSPRTASIITSSNFRRERTATES